MSGQGQSYEEAYKKVDGMNPTQYLGYSGTNNVYPTFPPLIKGQIKSMTLMPVSKTSVFVD